MSMKLNDRALLVQLNISQWTARKYDRRVTEAVASSHGASLEVGRFNKSLLAANDYLAAVHSLAGAIRTDFYANTLAWGIEGTRLLPTANYLAFMTKFRTYKTDWNTAVSTFMQAYPSLKHEARMFLPNGLYNEDDYPTQEKLEYKFRMDMAVFPIPADDFRVNLSNDELSRIQSDVTRRVQEAQSQAMREVWQRLYDKVKHMSDKLVDMRKNDDLPEGSKAKTRFHESTIENVRDLCAILPRLNFTDDPDLEAMRQRVEESLASVEVEAIKTDRSFREHTATEAQNILSAMATFMGGQ
jgi:hypothetical protein